MLPTAEISMVGRKHRYSRISINTEVAASTVVPINLGGQFILPLKQFYSANGTKVAAQVAMKALKAFPIE